MGKKQINAKLKIHKSKLEAFKGAADNCTQSVRTKDSCALPYEWSFIGGPECVGHERDLSSNAVLEHTGRLRETLRELFETYSDWTEIFGTPW